MKLVLSLILFLSVIGSLVLAIQLNCVVQYNNPLVNTTCLSTVNSIVCPTINRCLSWGLQYESDVLAIEITPPSTPLNNDCIGQLDDLSNTNNLVLFSNSYVTFDCQDQKFLNLTLQSNTTITFKNLGFTSQSNVPTTTGNGGLISIINVDPNGMNKLVFINANVKNVMSEAGGGFLYVRKMMVDIIYSNFVGCFAYGYGGAIYSDDDFSIIALINSTFVSNQAQGLGGLIKAANVISMNSIYKLNHAQFGGSIYTAVYVEVMNSTFDQNYASGSGSAIYSAGLLTAYVQNSHFTTSQCVVNGGAIYALNLSVMNTFFVGNAAYSGGALYSVYSLNILNCKFIENNAFFDGGAILTGGNISINNGYFFDNQAVFSGGAIYSQYGAFEHNIYNSNFQNNKARDGGAINCYGKTTFDLTNTIFYNNSALSIAGGIYFNYFYPSKFVSGLFLNSTSGIPNSQTFNTVNMQDVYSVNVSTSILNSGQTIYSVPLVFDSSSQYVKAIGVTGQKCINGLATIDTTGYVSACSCFPGFSGSSCL